MKSKNLKFKVMLTAESSRSLIIEKHLITTDKYYDSSLDIIDSASYRKKHGVRRLVGEIFDGDGCLDQCFNNIYSANGELLRTRVVHKDGTIIEKTFS